MFCRQILANKERCGNVASEKTSFCDKHHFGDQELCSVIEVDGQEKQMIGAGLLLIEDHPETGRPMIWLFRDRWKNEYEDLGGGYDSKHGTQIIQTMKAEAEEESAGLIRVEEGLEYFQFWVDRQSQPNYYSDRYSRLYFLKVKNFCPELFYHNLAVIRKNLALQPEEMELEPGSSNPPNPWLETDQVTSVYLDDFLAFRMAEQSKDRIVENYLILNTLGEEINLGRPRFFNDKDAQKVILEANQMKPIDLRVMLEKNICFDQEGGRQFLEGTYFYRIWDKCGYKKTPLSKPIFSIFPAIRDK